MSDNIELNQDYLILNWYSLSSDEKYTHIIRWSKEELNNEKISYLIAIMLDYMEEDYYNVKGKVNEDGTVIGSNSKSRELIDLFNQYEELIFKNDYYTVVADYKIMSISLDVYVELALNRLGYKDFPNNFIDFYNNIIQKTVEKREILLARQWYDAYIYIKKNPNILRTYYYPNE